jgi:hypothetical protein
VIAKPAQRRKWPVEVRRVTSADRSRYVVVRKFEVGGHTIAGPLADLRRQFPGARVDSCGVNGEVTKIVVTEG